MNEAEEQAMEVHGIRCVPKNVWYYN